MRAGRLRHQLIAEWPDTVRSDTGSESLIWRELITIRAGIEPIKGTERLIGNQILADLDTKIVVRWSPRVDEITAKFRLRHPERSNPTIYNIAATPIHINLGRREVHFLCKSGVNRGQ